MAKRKKPIYGFLDSCGTRSISGWARNPGAPHKSTDVDIFVNGKLRYTVTTNRHREDVRAQDLHQTGECGFQLDLPVGEHLNVHDRVEACVLPGKHPLINSPQVVGSRRNPHDTKFFFLHIPKTAGTAFRQAISENFTSEATFPTEADIECSEGHYPNLFGETEKGKYAACDLFLGHYPYAIRHLLADDVRTIVFLRDPVQRAISNLLHIKNVWPGFEDKSLDDVLSIPHIVANQLSNLQVRYLSDTLWSQPLQYFHAAGPDATNLENALENLEKISFVGLTQEYDVSLQMLEARYGLNLASSRLNVTRSKDKVDVDQEIVDRIAACNEMDRVLYERAQALFAEQKNALAEVRPERPVNAPL